MRVVLIRSTEVMPDPPVEKMAATLLDAGHEVRILAWDRGHCYREKSSAKQLTNGDVELVQFGIPAKYSGGMKSNLKAIIVFQFRILRWLFRHRHEYDAIHAFDFDTGFAAMLCARILRKKLIYHILDYYVDGHSISGKRLGALIRFWETRVINSADATIICTEKRKSQLGAASPKMLVVIHNTPDHAQQTECAFALKGDPHRTRIAYVGILASKRLLKEAAEAIAQMEDVEMHIGGFGEYEAWFQTAAQRWPNVFYYGKLQYAETLALEKQCDLMIAAYDPSMRNHRYAAPNKFYESIMLGKPLIMARGTGCSEVIEANDIGILTEYSQEGVSQSIRELVQRKAEWQAMGERAKRVYESAYSWEEMSKRIRMLYSELEMPSR